MPVSVKPRLTGINESPPFANWQTTQELEDLEGKSLVTRRSSNEAIVAKEKSTI